MSVEVVRPVEFVAPLPSKLELRHTPASNLILRLVTAAMILATVTVVTLGRPGGTLGSTTQVSVSGP